MNFRRCLIQFLALLALSCAAHLPAQPLRTQDLAGSGSDILFKGGGLGIKTGSSVAFGDINGDGIDDLIVGAPLASAPSRPQAGAVYLFYGKKDFAGNLILDLASVQPDVTILGDDHTDFLGSRVAVGDVNGDGKTDLVASGWGVDVSTRSNCGGVYIIHGKSTLSSLIDLDKTAADLTIYGRYFFDEMGRSLAVGDINNDGVDDIFTGAPDANPGNRGNAGEAYAIFGSKTYPPNAVIDLLNRLADISIYGRYSFNHMGSSIAAGDFNNDGIDDLVVGARYASQNLVQAGETYVIHGRSTWSTPHIVDLGTGAKPDFTVIGRYSNDNLSTSLAVGDVNNDGLNDLLTTAFGSGPGWPNTRVKAGEANVIYGRYTYGAHYIWSLDVTPPDIRVMGRFAGDRLGQGGVLADLDADGVLDIVVAAPEASPASRTKAGMVFMIRGGSFAASTLIDLSKVSTDWEVQGASQGDTTGQLALAAGDFNGDGQQDLAMGTPEASFSTLNGAGGVRILYGGYAHALDAPRVGTNMRIKLTAPGYPDTYRLGAAAFTGYSGILIDTRVFPLDPDVLFFTSLVLPDVFKDYSGFLTATGEATATLAIPDIPALAGITIYSAFALLDRKATSGMASPGNRLHIRFVL